MIDVADDDGVRLVTWNRPDALNAMSLELWDGTRDALRSAVGAGIRCIVVTGTGRGFTVGQDLAEMTDPRHADGDRGFRGVMAALADLDVALIAAVNGLAVGFGTTMLPWCDVALAGESARFRVPFVSQPPDALRTTTRLLHAGRTDAWRAAIERENAEFARLAGGPENLAAIDKFFTKT